jgi:hypothetical protein
LPRVDPGWIVLDRPSVEKTGYRELMDIAFESETYLVTKPSIVTVRRDLRTMRISLSIGSLILSPDSGVEGPILTRPEWIDGCKVGSGEKKELARVMSGETIVVDGRLTAVDYSDPIAMAVNGVKGTFKIAGAISQCIPLVDLNGIPVLGVREDGTYCTSIVDGDVIGFLEYITTLYTSCYGR